VLTSTSLALSQHKYALDILSRASTSSYKPVDTPVSVSKINLQSIELFSNPIRFCKLLVFYSISSLLDQTFFML